MPLLEYGSRHVAAVIEGALNKSLENDVPKIEGSGSDACSFEVVKRLGPQEDTALLSSPGG